jgi:hypothetical protein
MVEPRQSALQRIQVGLVGLVVVLLFVSLANMVLDRVAHAPATSRTPGIAGSSNMEPASEEAPAEPLAELGITPVAKDEGPTGGGSAPAASNNGQRANPNQRR